MSLIRDLSGGLVIILAGGLIGIAQTAVRDDTITLVPRVARVAAERTAESAAHSANPGIEASGDQHAAPETAAYAKSSQPTAGELSSGQVTLERLRILLETGDVVLIDARSVHEFNAGHIAGAIHIPYNEFVDYFETLQARVPSDAVVICYCESLTCDESESLATELKLMGYTTVLVYQGGWQEWEQGEHGADE